MSKHIFAAFSLAIAVTAQAGDFGKGVAVGVAGTIIVQEVQQHRSQQPQLVIIEQPAPRVVRVPSPRELNRTPRPTRQELCHFPGYHARVYDQYDMVMGYRVCY